MTRAFDRHGQRALMSRAGSEFAARLDLATLGEVATHARDVFVINFFDVVRTKSANLSTRAEATATAAAATATRTSAVAATLTTAVAAAISAFTRAFGARGAEA